MIIYAKILLWKYSSGKKMIIYAKISL